MPLSSLGIPQGLVFATPMSYMGQSVNINQPEYVLLECPADSPLDERIAVIAMLWYSSQV